MFDATSFAHQHLAIICYSSPHLFTSQALSGWMGADAHFQVSPEIFDWVQFQALAVPLKDIHRVVYKPLLLCVRSIVLLEGEPSAQSEVLNAGLRLSLFWCIELVFYSDESLSPCCWKTAPQHEAATSTLYFWDRTLHVMSSAWFPSNMMLGIEVHQTR